MPGRVLRLIPRRNFTYGDLQANQEQTIVVAERVDVSQFRYATLLVRGHAVNIGSSASIDILALPSGFTQEDPGQDFRGSTALATITFDEQTAEPAFETVELSAGTMGSMVDVAVIGKQPGTPVSIDVDLSIDLVLKD